MPLGMLVTTTNRGWAYQERQLPSRVLHFTSQETIFKCKQSINCECYGEYNRPVADIVTWTGKPEYARNPEEKLDEVIRGWHSEASKYPALRLTRETDRLPAFSGIAQKYSVHKLGRYLAGMWEASLSGSLFWECAQTQFLPHTRPLSYLAPTWFWASSMGPHLSPYHVRWYDNSERWRCAPCVLEVHCEPAGKDPFGEVSSGFIRVRGMIRHTTKGDIGGWLWYDSYDFREERFREKDPKESVTLLGFHGLIENERAYRMLIIEPSLKSVGAFEPSEVTLV